MKEDAPSQWQSKTVGTVILIPDKIDCKPKTGDNTQRRTIYNVKRDNSPGRHNSY